MSNREETQNNESQKTRGSTKLVRSLHLMIIVLLSAWIALAYLHVAYLPGFMTGVLTANGFVLRVALIAVLGGFILSRPIFRNLSRSARLPKSRCNQYRNFAVPEITRFSGRQGPQEIRILSLGRQRIGEESPEIEQESDFLPAIKSRNSQQLLMPSTHVAWQSLLEEC